MSWEDEDDEPSDDQQPSDDSHSSDEPDNDPHAAFSFSESAPEPTDVGKIGDADTNLGRETSGRELAAWRCGAEIQGFRLLKELGTGATGVVYRAVKIASGQQVALKLLIRSHYRELTRLKRGFRAIVDVDHPNLLKMYELHQYQDRCFVTMEEIDGGPLYTELKREAIDDVDAFYERIGVLLMQAAEALAALHRRSLVHRDVKPNNLLVDSSGNLRLIDYGLVGSFDPESDPDAHRGYVAGTREYMAPEVLGRQIYPPASDIYGLARVFTKLVRIRHPQRDSVKRAADCPLPTDAPEELQSLFKQMLATNTSERPAASEIASLLGGRAEQSKAKWQTNYSIPIFGRRDALDFVTDWLPRVVRGETRRLHIRGDSGVGKSRFLDEVASHFSQNSWLQVFHSRCRLREDVPMQAFDEVIDTLACRYSRSGSHELSLDPVSAEVLRTSFPVLKPVLAKAQGIRRPRDRNRSEAADASLALTEQVCQHGPVVLIIDDVQWADAASFVLIRRLQNEVQGQLAIITSSRADFDPPDVEPNEILDLPPLADEDAFRLLTLHLRLRQIQLDAEDIRKLSVHAQGSPYHLLHLAACVASADAGSVAQWLARESLDIRELWMQRYASLQPASRTLLTAFATAGGPVEETELREFTGLGDETAVALGELRREQLVHIRFGNVQSFEIGHDRIAESVLNSIPIEDITACHRRWAEYLSQPSHPPVSAARIAGHLIAGEDLQKALPRAIAAAEEAEGRFAYRDAGDWYARVVTLAHGDHESRYLRKAAECHATGGRHRDAAKMYERLSEVVAGTEATGCRASAAEQYIRAGDLNAARQTISSIAERLKLPRPKHRLLMIAHITLNLTRLRLRGGYSFKATRRKPAPAFEERMRICIDLSRPLAIYDNLYAAELATTGILELQRCGDERQRLYGAVVFAVFSSYDEGWWRRHSAALLPQILSTAERLGDPESQAHAMSALGIHYWLQGQFADSLRPLKESHDAYRDACEGRILEAVRLRLLILMTQLFLGRLQEFTSTAATVFNDARDRDDSFAQHVSSLGFAGAAWLVRDDVSGLRKLTRKSRSAYRGVGRQMFHFLHMYGVVLRKLYLGRTDHALRLLDLYHRHSARSGHARIQIARVLWYWLRINAAIQMAGQELDKRTSYLRDAEFHCAKLRSESLAFAQMLSDFFRGRISEARGEVSAAIEAYRTARSAADEQQIQVFALAAADGIARLQSREEAASNGSQLHRFFTSAGVVDPFRFEKIYLPPAEAKP